ncbi:MAG: bifunctional methylenetetrahydrofolate dehydrogenase/methenyltetrahydrofolate cyclohydrolase FolD [Candidatus Borkfalkiaceae bacterium]|nr:bifunctional methylenetetrahydrofolate dehydrogenase/methenyltetrahydrofolate cyclohydrolase FolD [Christensenellaceae bacterium]
MSVVIDGKATAAKIRASVKNDCDKIFAVHGKRPKLAIVLVGDNPASQIYVASKERACAEVGMESVVVRLPENSDQNTVEKTVSELCLDETINGVMVQLPLPKTLNEKPVLELIPFEKDVDGLTSANAGRLFHGEKCLVPCTPKGVIALLKEYDIPLSGKNAVIIGRSNLVGKPLSILLLNENCTVTVCHSKTERLSDFTKKADILVVAIGKDRFVKSDMVKPDAVVIDVGINRTEDGLHGDVDYQSVKEIVGYITPVPGGVGPMTVAMLLQNTVEAFNLQNSGK